MIHARIKRFMLTICLLASSLECFASVADAEPAVPVTAIWHLQQVKFSFRSGRVYYSCNGLRAKIAAILNAVGARDGVGVELPCHSNALTNNALTVITIASPIEASAENVQAATTYSTQAQLVARLNKNDLPTANDVYRFPAEWRMVKLGNQRKPDLDAGDCELLRALSQQVFPQLAIRLARGRLSCPATASSRWRPKLQVRALMPATEGSVAYAREGK